MRLFILLFLFIVTSIASVAQSDGSQVPSIGSTRSSIESYVSGTQLIFAGRDTLESAYQLSDSTFHVTYHFRFNYARVQVCDTITFAMHASEAKETIIQLQLRGFDCKVEQHGSSVKCIAQRFDPDVNKIVTRVLVTGRCSASKIPDCILVTVYEQE